ncbi:MAG: Na+/H+ antiporter subunit G [Myxococcota bacterium]
MELLISTFLIVGAAFVLLGSYGLVKLPDIYARLHAPTKATTLGVGCLLVASALHASQRESGLSVHELLITAFLFLTAPVSAYLIARAALHLEIQAGTKLPQTKEDESSARSAGDLDRG